MNTSAFVRLIFLKDVRKFRYMLLLLLSLTVSTVIVALARPPVNMDASILIIGDEIYIFLLTIRVVQADPTGREFRFLLTRPVSGFAIGFAKALFLILFLFVPFLSIAIFIAAGLQVPLQSLDYLMLLIETAIPLGAALALVVLYSSYLQNQTYVILTAVILMALMNVGIQAQGVHYNFGMGLHIETIFLIIASIAIGTRYLTKESNRPMIIAIMGAVLSLIAGFCSNDFSQWFKDRSGNTSALTSDQLGLIHMTVNENSVGFRNEAINDTLINETCPFVEFRGLPFPVVIQEVACHAVITLHSGKTIKSDYAYHSSENDFTWMNSSAIEAVAGAQPSQSFNKGQLELLTCHLKDFRNEDAIGATVKGTVTLNILCPYVTGSMPVHAGASWTTPRRRIEIESADFSKDGGVIVLNTVHLPLVYRGDGTEMEITAPTTIAVYRPYNEALFIEGSTAEKFEMEGGYVRTHQTLKLGRPNPDTNSAWRPLPPDCGSGMELVFTKNASCGQLTLPFEFTLRYQINQVDSH